MIIGIDARTLQDQHYSGVSEYAYQLIKALLELDRKNEYRLFYNSSRSLSGRLPIFDHPRLTVEKFDYPNKLLNYGLMLPFNYPKLDELLGGIDVFFAPHLNFLAISKKSRLVITIHDLSFLRYPELFSWRKNFWHKLIDAKKLAQKADCIIAVSHNTKRDIIGLLGVPTEKITVIHSGIETGIEAVEDMAKLEEIKNKYNLPAKFFLSLGTIEPRKNLEALISAFELFKKSQPDSPHQLVLVGGPGWKDKPIKAKAKASPYANQIIFIGYADNAEKSALYSLADGLAYPSLYEGFGFPPLEAAKCGTPVLTSYSSSLTELLDKDNIFVDPYDIADIARGLKRLALMKKRPQAVPDWQEAATSYLKIFESLN
jgi:glycosyltransferase involved in cell wall biosynthesis